MKKEHISVKDINENIDAHIAAITKEFRNGFEFLKKYPKTVTIFGSSRLTEASSHFHDASKLAEKIVKEAGYGVITGGGPGIMGSANEGAHKAGGQSLGLNIILPMEQQINPHVTDSMQFDYFFARKALMNFGSECYIFFPGGFGTFDELFGVLTLLQTNKIPKVPVILFGKDFWNPTVELIKKQMLDVHHTIEAEDMNLFKVTDSMDSVIKVIKEAPVSEWWKLID